MALATEDEPLTATPEIRSSRPVRAAAITCVIGVLLTAAAAWASYRVDENSEERLLDTQSKQVVAVLETAIYVIQQPLTTALQVQAASGPNGDPSVFRRTFAVNIGDNNPFVAASLWRSQGGTTKRLAAVGVQPGIDPGGQDVQDFLGRALDTDTMVVQRVEMGDHTRYAYALADHATGLIVKVEQALPNDRRAADDGKGTYDGLDYAIYLGTEQRQADLTTTNIDPAELPLHGSTIERQIGFGDTKLTLVTRRSEHLGSSLSERLPLLLLLGGLLLTGATALVARQLVASRIRVEANAATISALYERINRLYEEQRDVFLRLQRALLPQVIPEVPELEIASKYVAGAEGVEIGGDWYSVIDVGEDQFGFVVGDVSGRGVDAVAEMARARFTLRTYLLDGNAPAEALAKCARQFDIAVDDHIVTAVVGLGTWSTGEIVIANAGHPLPLLLSPEGTEHIAMPVGPPLGVGASSYQSATLTMPPGSTLVAYTDGLVERRGEDIDAGMRRLLAAADRHRDEPVSELLSSLLDDLRGDGAPDDIALLALRRVPQDQPALR